MADSPERSEDQVIVKPETTEARDNQFHKQLAKETGLATNTQAASTKPAIEQQPLDLSRGSQFEVVPNASDPANMKGQVVDEELGDEYAKKGKGSLLERIYNLWFKGRGTGEAEELHELNLKRVQDMHPGAVVKEVKKKAA